MMMSKKAAIPLMIAWRMPAMPLTIAIRQAPMARNIDVIYTLMLVGILVNWERCPQ